MRRSVTWPDGKMICATFTVALEASTKVGHFKNASVPEPNLFSLSHVEYGGNVGIWRIMEILHRSSARATIDISGLAVEKWPEVAIALTEAGHELAGHGYANDVRHTSMSPAEQREDVRRATRIIAETTGERPVGWISPGGSNHTAETLGILADEGYMWWGDRCDDDLPYVEHVNNKPIVIIPKLNWYFNDLRACNGGGLAGAEAFQAFKYAFDFVREEALRGRPGRIDAIVHSELGGRPYMAYAYERILCYCKAHADLVWFPTRKEIAEYMLRAG